MSDPTDASREPQRLAALRATGLLDSPPEISFDRLVRLAARLTGASGAAVSLIDEDRQFFKAAHGLNEKMTTQRQLPLEQSICRHVVATGKTLVLADSRDCPGFVCQEVRAYLGIPLVTANGFVLGSFCVFDSVPRHWSGDDIATMSDLAASVGTEIELRTDIARRARLERELSAVSGRFEAYMGNTPALAYAKDEEGRYAYLNPKFSKFLGPDYHTFLGKTDYDITDKRVSDQIRSNDRLVWQAGTPMEFIEESCSPAGERSWWLSLKFSYVTPEGEKLLGGLSYEISEILRTQEALRRSEAESRTLAVVVARINGAVAVADADCRLEWVSEAYARLFGDQPEAVIGQDLIRRSLGPDADLDQVATLRARLMAGQRVEVAAVRRDARGRRAWLELEVQAVRAEGNAPDQFIAIGRDVTDRRRAEGRMAALQSCDATLFDSTTLNEAIPRLLASVGAALDMERAIYWRVDPETHRLDPGPRWMPGGSADSTNDPPPADRIFAEEIYRVGRGQVLVSPSASGGLGWPVACQGQVRGVFTFSSQEPVDDLPALDEIRVGLERQVGLFNDRQRAEEERNRLVAIFEDSDDFVGICDINGLVIWRNAAFRRLIEGDSPLPTAGYPITAAYTDWSARIIYDVAHPEAARSGSWLGETAIQATDGRIIPMSQRIMAHRGPDGKLAYFATILRDISASKAVEAELLAARDAAEAASRAKGEFLANVSHEIRTPMNGIIGMTDLTLDTALSSLQREYLGMVRSSAESLMSVINDILDFSKIEAGKLTLERVRFSLHDLLYQTLRPLALRAHTANLDLVCRTAPDVPDLVAGDPHRLRQILVNLVGNAVKFTAAGEIIVEVTRCPLADPETRPDADPVVELHFRVADTGIGIAPDKLATVFEPFEQADGSTTRIHGGTGLGLAISTDLTHLMGGRIWVESQLGKGSVFHFTSRLGWVADPSSRGERALLTGLRFLLAVANPGRRRFTVEVLGGWGAITSEEATGPGAIEELRRGVQVGRPYDGAVVDDRLVDLGEIDLIGKILAEPGVGPTALVIITTPGRSDLAGTEVLRIAATVPKPVSPRDLFEAIRGRLQPGDGPLPLTSASARSACRVGSPTGSAPPSAPSGPPAPLTAASSRPLRVLLAEDQLVNRKVATRLLERLGHSVTTAEDGRKALALVERATFDVVLMDIQMPVMDGFETLASIRRVDSAPMTLVAMTAHALNSDRERCLAAGFDDYLSKPIRVEDLRAVLDRVPVSPPAATGKTPAPTAPAAAAGWSG